MKKGWNGRESRTRKGGKYIAEMRDYKRGQTNNRKKRSSLDSSPSCFLMSGSSNALIDDVTGYS